MKKFLSIMLITAIAVSLISCSKKESPADTDEPIRETVTEDILAETEETEETEKTDTEDTKEPEAEQVPATPSKPQQAEPQNKPQTPKPEEKPTTPTGTKPQESATTLGGILANEFKQIASDHSDAMSIAQALSESKSIQFSGMATPVEPGYLTGFTDKEIHGFTEGAMFGPMIGTIPFVGYVFVAENESLAASLAETLKKSADLRWNLCTEAEEMHTAIVGNKVFFVMCPESME